MSHLNSQAGRQLLQVFYFSIMFCFNNIIYDLNYKMWFPDTWKCFQICLLSHCSCLLVSSWYMTSWDWLKYKTGEYADEESCIPLQGMICQYKHSFIDTCPIEAKDTRRLCPKYTHQSSFECCMVQEQWITRHPLQKIFQSHLSQNAGPHILTCKFIYPFSDLL